MRCIAPLLALVSAKVFATDLEIYYESAWRSRNALLDWSHNKMASGPVGEKIRVRGIIHRLNVDQVSEDQHTVSSELVFSYLCLRPSRHISSLESDQLRRSLECAVEHNVECGHAQDQRMWKVYFDGTVLPTAIFNITAGCALNVPATSDHDDSHTCTNCLLLPDAAEISLDFDENVQLIGDPTGEWLLRPNISIRVFTANGIPLNVLMIYYTISRDPSTYYTWQLCHFTEYSAGINIILQLFVENKAKASSSHWNGSNHGGALIRQQFNTQALPCILTMIAMMFCSAQMQEFFGSRRNLPLSKVSGKIISLCGEILRKLDAWEDEYASASLISRRTAIDLNDNNSGNGEMKRRFKRKSSRGTGIPTEAFTKHMHCLNAQEISCLEKIKCGTCCKILKHEHSLQLHMKTHINDEMVKKPYACKVCSSRFSQEVHLRQHE